MPDPFSAHRHDHSACIQDALTRAEQHCTSQGLRLTDTRRRVLELIWGDHKPVGAYTLLDLLSEDGHKPAPPTVYRALDFLLENSLIHRIASQNAYIGCAHPGEAHNPQFFICEDCGHAAEIQDERIQKAIDKDAANLDFDIASETIEISGRCGDCRDKTRHDD